MPRVMYDFFASYCTYHCLFESFEVVLCLFSFLHLYTERKKIECNQGLDSRRIFNFVGRVDDYILIGRVIFGSLQTETQTTSESARKILG